MAFETAQAISKRTGRRAREHDSLFRSIPSTRELTRGEYKAPRPGVTNLWSDTFYVIVRYQLTQSSGKDAQSFVASIHG